MSDQPQVQVEGLTPAFTIDDALRPAWDALALPGVTLRGLAATVASGRAAAVVVTDRPLGDDELRDLGAGLGGTLGVPVEVAALDAQNLLPLVRQWVNQAAQAAGRGVHVRVEEPDAAPGSGEPAALRVLVRAIDSSARELAFRLRSPHEPALPALRALLARPVTVEDAETAG